MFNEVLPPVIAIAVLAIFFAGAFAADIRNIRGRAPLREAHHQQSKRNSILARSMK
jgi:hypothetical protein